MASQPRRITVNGASMDWADGCRSFCGLTGQDAIIAAGGLLLKAAMDAEGQLVLFLGPNYRNGQRMYHYNMIPPSGCGLAVSGGINPNGTMTLLPDPQTQPADVAQVGATCILAARALVDAGLDPGMPLVELSRQALSGTGVFEPAPQTIGELALLDLPAN